MGKKTVIQSLWFYQSNMCCLNTPIELISSAAQEHVCLQVDHDRVQGQRMFNILGTFKKVSTVYPWFAVHLLLPLSPWNNLTGLSQKWPNFLDSFLQSLQLNLQTFNQSRFTTRLHIANWWILSSLASSWMQSTIIFLK